MRPNISDLNGIQALFDAATFVIFDPETARLATLFPSKSRLLSDGICLISLSAFPALAQPSGQSPALEAGLVYLSTEALDWPEENHCFSCHNNGDAARVLFRLGNERVRSETPKWNDLLQWLNQPALWEKSTSSDVVLSPALALIQFGLASVAAEEQKLIQTNPRRTKILTDRLLASQHPEGYWAVEADGHLGSPGTYGNPLATALALEILATAVSPETKAASEKAKSWMMNDAPTATIDLAAGIMILHQTQSNPSDLLSAWIRRLIESQTLSGGWGPYPNRFPEVFDSSIALLALASQRRILPGLSSLKAGRAFLIEAQEVAGGWPETTRPTGGSSYAQHISTSAWAIAAIASTEDL